MYFKNISDKELRLFRQVKTQDFIMSLTDILDSNLFKIEDNDGIYRIFPLFYCNNIKSNNPTDNILENRCIIASKRSDETYFTFSTDESSELPLVPNTFLNDSFKGLNDNLTIEEYNKFVYLLRNNCPFYDNIRLNKTVNGDYGNYHFRAVDGDVGTILDNGILLSDSLKQNGLQVMLSEPLFHYSRYVLHLKVYDFGDGDIPFDGDVSNADVTDFSVELVRGEYVDIQFSGDYRYAVIGLDVLVEVLHDAPELHYVTGLKVDATKNILQSGETTDISSQLLDVGGYPYELDTYLGRIVHFYEVLTPTINVTATANILQSDDTTDISAKVRDADGSIPVDAKVYFYKETAGTVVYTNDGTDVSTLTIDSGASVTVVNEGLEITTSTTGEKYVKYPTLFSSTDNLLFECEIGAIGVNQSCAMFVKNATTANGCWFAYNDSEGKFSGAITGSSFSKNVGSLNIGDKIKIKQENGMIMLYHNNNLIYSKTVNLGSDYQIGHYTNKDRKQYIKNIKILKE